MTPGKQKWFFKATLLYLLHFRRTKTDDQTLLFYWTFGNPRTQVVFYWIIVSYGSVKIRIWKVFILFYMIQFLALATLVAVINEFLNFHEEYFWDNMY